MLVQRGEDRSIEKTESGIEPTHTWSVDFPQKGHGYSMRKRYVLSNGNEQLYVCRPSYFSHTLHKKYSKWITDLKGKAKTI